jgi:Fibronectin type III domain
MIMTARPIVINLSWAFILATLVACGGGGGGGAESLTPASVEVSGNWNVQETIDNTACGGTGDADNYVLTAVQAGNSLTVTKTTGGSFTGSVSARTVSWSGTLQLVPPDNPGTVTVNFSGTVSDDKNTLTGTASWNFVGAINCSGTTRVTATRASSGGGSALSPAQPSGLVASTVSESAIDLVWVDNASDEDGFFVERSNSQSGTFSRIAALRANSTSYRNSGLGASTQYFYRVAAHNSTGTSPYVGPVSATTAAPSVVPPAAPSGLGASATSVNSITLTWIDNSNNETGFKIERAASATGTFTQISQVGAGSTTFADSGLAAATGYSYRVRATNSAGDSAYSAVVSASTPATVAVPAAPSGLVASPTSTSSIALSWIDNSSNETGFKIERAASATGTFTQISQVGAGSTTFADSGLAAATGYSYRVRATNSAGDSAYSAVVSASTPATVTIPAAPSGLVASASVRNSIELSWIDNSNNETGFKIERGTSRGSFTQIATTSANVVNYRDAGLNASTTYYYQVRATNSAGDSAYTALALATTPSTSTTVTLFSQYDNLIMNNSTITAIANNVNQTGELAVGCNWTYSLVTSLQDFVCAQSLIRFDLSSLAGRTIESATLTLTTNYLGVGSNPRNWHIRAMLSSWSPNTVTWNIIQNTQFYTASETIHSPPTVGGQHTFNLTATVQNWVNGTYNNNGLIFGSQNYTFPQATSFDAFSFYSREGGSTVQPMLSVTYR